MKNIGRMMIMPLDFLENALLAACVIMYATMTAVAFVGVILRYFFEIYILWQSELLPFVFVWGVFLGAAAVTRTHDHIRVSFFAEKIFGGKLAPKVWTTVENYAGFAATAYIAYLSFQWVHESYVSGAMRVSDPSYGLWVPRMGILIGMGLVSLFYLERIVKQVISWFTPTNGQDEDKQTTESA